MIRSLILISILALQVYSLSERETEKAALFYTIKVFRRAFGGFSVLQIQFRENHGEIEWINQKHDHFVILELLKLTLFELPDCVTY